MAVQRDHAGHRGDEGDADDDCENARAGLCEHLADYEQHRAGNHEIDSVPVGGGGGVKAVSLPPGGGVAHIGRAAHAHEEQGEREHPEGGGAQGLALAHARDVNSRTGIGGGASLVPAEGLLAHFFRVLYKADDGEEADCKDENGEYAVAALEVHDLEELAGGEDPYGRAEASAGKHYAGDLLALFHEPVGDNARADGVGAEGDGEGGHEAGQVVEHECGYVLPGYGEGVKVHVYRAGKHGDEHGGFSAELAERLYGHEAEHDVADGVHRAYIAHHAEVPAAVFAERGKEYAEGGAGAEVDEHDQESAYRRLIAEKFLGFVHFFPSLKRYLLRNAPAAMAGALCVCALWTYFRDMAA